MPVLEVPVRAQTRRRVRNRLPVVVVLWIASVLVTGWIASTTTVGPVVYELTTRRGMHLADVFLVAGVAVVMAVVSWALLRPPRPSGAEDREVVSVELRRLPLIVALWLAVMLGSLWAAFETEVGPVLFVYNNHRSVRLGDLLATVAMVAVAAWATVVLLRPAGGDRAER